MRRPGLPIREVAGNPRLWLEGVRAYLAISRKDWWRRPPFLPNPDRQYLEWRMQTAYGRTDADIEPGELRAYLGWRRRQRRA